MFVDAYLMSIVSYHIEVQLILSVLNLLRCIDMTMDSVIESLDLKDCFVDAKEILDVTSEQIMQLRLQIEKEIRENEYELNRGIELLAACE